MLMGMAQRPLDGGTLTLRTMLSLDPFMGKGGYPLLLGHRRNGGRQDAVGGSPASATTSSWSWAGVYSHPIDKQSSGFLYVGWPGEPALGPVTFMHRFSGEANPEAPIDHHWLDSTHITFGVVTAGYIWGPVKLEASDFTGREPNQKRWDFDHPRFDSWSVRTTLNPTRDLSMQVSYGYLKSPEQLEPDVNQRRTTASVTYNLPYKGGNWQSLLAWGRDQNEPGHTLDAYLAENGGVSGQAHGVRSGGVGAEGRAVRRRSDQSPVPARIRRIQAQRRLLLHPRRSRACGGGRRRAGFGLRSAVGANALLRLFAHLIHAVHPLQVDVKRSAVPIL